MLYIVLLCAVLSVARTQDALPLLVNITQGTVQGELTPDGFYAFYGIHYAGAITRENRFKAPTPAPAYPGVFHAIDSNVICSQPTSRGLVGVEDCLTLNVFTTLPTVPPRNKPVLVWLIGDEYTNTDTSSRSFRNLVNDVVIVQINYRVSIFGFLCLGVEEAPGNAGLRDIVQGLRWIQQDIAGFDGDRNNVILFGHGSGAAMVDLITMSPSANNLVHKAIAQSGSALSPWAIAYNPIEAARAVGTRLGYTGRNNSELARRLASTDLSVLGGVLNDFELLNNTALFAPCIENVNLNPNDTFLADAPINLLRRGNFSHIPYIAGYTDREGTIRAEEAAFSQWLEKMQANFTAFLQVDLDFQSNLTSVERTIRDYYFAQRAINSETIEDFLDYHGDTMILVSVIRGARERALTSTAPVRLYGFEYRGTMNSDWITPTIPITGARHGAVLNFLLNYDLRPVDDDVMRSLVGRYVGFFSNGIPIQAVNPGPEWLPITSSAMNFLLYSGGEAPSVNTSETARVNPHQQRMTFWDDLYFKYYTPPSAVSAADRVFAVTITVMFASLFARFL